ncbi:MAG: hypothetical protein ABIG44_17550 [Planctomycetota bacterium]
MWPWLRKIINCSSAEELRGASISEAPFWEVTAPKDHAGFVRVLSGFLPDSSVLYLEGGSPSHQITDWLETRVIEPSLKIALGTIWPRPKAFHVPATAENVLGLAELFEHHATPEIAIHFHAYRAEEVLLQWHDAFFSDPLLLSPTIPEKQVAAFCARCGCAYKWTDK